MKGRSRRNATDLTLRALVLAASIAGATPAWPQGQLGQYQQQMLRLAEILGGLHHLRPLCIGREEQVWRNEMLSLLRLESPSQERRNELIAQFNKGYEAAQASYPACDREARDFARRLAGEGSVLSRELAGNIAL